MKVDEAGRGNNKEAQYSHHNKFIVVLGGGGVDCMELAEGTGKNSLPCRLNVARSSKTFFCQKKENDGITKQHRFPRSFHKKYFKCSS